MKKLSLVFALTFGMLSTIFAQDRALYVKEMNKILSKVDSVKTPEQFTDVTNQLDRVSSRFPNEPMAYYYKGMLQTVQGFFSPDYNKSVASATETLNKINTEDSLVKSEVKTLYAMGNIVKISKDPMNNAPALTAPTMQLLQEAIQLNATNPRPYLLLTQFSLGKKSYFKEDISTECNEIPKLEELLKNQSKGELMPQWGADYLERIKKTCSAQK